MATDAINLTMKSADRDRNVSLRVSNLSSVSNKSSVSVASDATDHGLEESMSDFDDVVKYVIPVIFGAIALLGFVGNLLVIIVVVVNKQMRNTTNVLINSLAVADLLFIVVCVPFTAIGFVVPVWPFGTFFCKLYEYVIHVTAHASVYTLVLMSVDRYLAVVHPIRSMTIRTERNAYLAIGVSWLVIGAANVPMFLEFDVVALDDYNNCTVCTNLKILDDEGHAKVFYGSFFAFAFAIPLAVVSVLYGIMIRKLLYGGIMKTTTSTCVAGRGGRVRIPESVRAKRRVTRMVVVVVLIFAVCWFPIQIVFMVSAFGTYPESIGFIAIKLASNCLAYMNSCINPILYAFLSENFRKSFRKVLGCLTGAGFQPVKTDALERTSIKALAGGQGGGTAEMIIATPAAENIIYGNCETENSCL